MESLTKIVCTLGLIGVFHFPARSTRADEGFAKLWPLEALKRVPKASWGKQEGIVREVYYESVSFHGKPTRVFAFYARPQTGTPPFPAMVLVHGGGGRAFGEWASLWARRGYAALAMDTNGRGPDGQHMENGGPEEDEEDIIKFRPFDASEAREMWTCQAASAVIAGHSWLASQPEVDPNRTGITGISWGGYLTLIVTGLDDRFRVSVPVYGGFLYENSYWVPQFERMPAEQRRQWIELFDPSRYLAGIRCPILFINGTNDYAYPLDSYQKSYRLVPGPVQLSIRVDMPHSHEDGWSPPEIYAFVDSILKGGSSFAQIDRDEAQTRPGESPLSVKSEGRGWSTTLHLRHWPLAEAEVAKRSGSG